MVALDFEPAVMRGALVGALRQTETRLKALNATDMTALSTAFLSGGEVADTAFNNFQIGMVDAMDTIARGRQIVRTGEVLPGPQTDMAIKLLSSSWDELGNGVMKTQAVVKAPTELDKLRDLFTWMKGDAKGSGPQKAIVGVSAVADALEGAGISSKAEISAVRDADKASAAAAAAAAGPVKVSAMPDAI